MVRPILEQENFSIKNDLTVTSTQFAQGAAKPSSCAKGDLNCATQKRTMSARLLASISKTHLGLETKRIAFAGFGAGDRDRTGDIQLGKLTFCH